jgi:hypothetical protein
MTTRADYKKLAFDRLQDAQILFAGRRYAAAYYMAGYAVECAIKVQIAARFLRHTVPTRQLFHGIYQHDLKELLAAAGLTEALKADSKADAALLRNWEIVKGWTVDTRYDPHRRFAEARDMLDAVAHPVNGVLSWIQRYW